MSTSVSAPLSPSSNTNANEPNEIQTWEIALPLSAVMLLVTMSIGTLTMVHCFEHFGPDSHPFKRTFYIFYMTYLLSLVACCCADAELTKMKENKSVQVQGRRPRRTSSL